MRRDSRDKSSILYANCESFTLKYLYEKKKLFVWNMAFYNAKLSHIATEKLFSIKTFLYMHGITGHACFKSYS